MGVGLCPRPGAYCCKPKLLGQDLPAHPCENQKVSFLPRVPQHGRVESGLTGRPAYDLALFLGLLRLGTWDRTTG